MIFLNKMFKKAMDPLSSETHFIGACLSVVGLLIFVVEGLIKQTSSIMMLGVTVFGISLIALYSASTIYHYFKGSKNKGHA